jgi:uncharacterized protein YwqG
MLFKVVGGSLILIVAGAIAARVAVAVLPEGRWRTRLIVGATFLGWFLWGALRKSSVNHWDQGLADQIAIVMSSAIIAAFWTVPAWLVCRRYDRRAATLPPAPPHVPHTAPSTPEEEYHRWFNSARLDRTVCGALATRMALRIFPFFAAKVSDAQDSARAKFYLELAAASLSALAVMRASSKYPEHILRSQPHDAQKWLERCNAAFSEQDATAREAAATAAAAVAVSKAETDKGSPLNDLEREQITRDAKRASRVSSFRADGTVSGAASTATHAIGVFTSHEIFARDMTRSALRGGDLEETRNALTSALEADVKALTSGADAGALSDMPLWPAGEPEWAAANWAALRDGLSQAAGWNVWSRWYEDRLSGSISADTPELIFTGKPEAAWNDGSKAWAAYLQKSLTKIADAAPVPSKEEQLQAEARTAVLLRRTDLPVSLGHPALSYLGGLPKLPTDFDWPRDDVAADDEEETVALTFLAQIDLSELPQFDGRMLLPERGTLFFFCSSVFEGEGEPPCRVLYYPESAAALPQREPPPDLMPLAGDGGDYQAEWLKKGDDLHACVEFKYPVVFLTFKDYGFKNDPIGEELLVKSLCKALGPGVPEDASLRLSKDANVFAKDEDWPFNWSLIKHVTRAIISRVESDLRPNSYRKPVHDKTRDSLLNLLAAANRSQDRAAAAPPYLSPDPEHKAHFRRWWGWWANAVVKYEGLKKDVQHYNFQFPDDVAKAITHNIKLLAEQGETALAQAPRKYVENFARRNHWTTPGQGAFSMAIHQILGHGAAVQNAPEEHRDDVLLLQLHGDDAFFPWHDNCMCVLQLWIEKDALSKRDFSGVQATLECD